ncbi:MAG: DUF2946 family protein [Bradyrhizobium sp.]
MKWFRSNIKHGVRLALFALAVQFALSFGHFHATAAQTSSAGQSAAAQAHLDQQGSILTPDTASQSAQPQSPSNHDSDQQPGDSCAICAVIALANTVLFATPPVLLLPEAVELLHLVTDAEFVHLNSARVAFQPRAPPLS